MLLADNVDAHRAWLIGMPGVIALLLRLMFDMMAYGLDGKGSGHWVMANPALWQQSVNTYLNTMEK